jgi:hypothetical protein
MAARLSALSAGHSLPPRRFLVHIFVRGWVEPRAIVRLEGLGKLKRSTSSGTRTSDLPACSILPQPSTLPRALLHLVLSLRLVDLHLHFPLRFHGMMFTAHREYSCRSAQADHSRSPQFYLPSIQFSKTIVQEICLPKFCTHYLYPPFTHPMKIAC